MESSHTNPSGATIFSLDPRELKRTADFLAIVSRYTKLRRAGSQYVGLCPFHREHTPSFYVDPQKKLFKCFGRCDAGGDIFNFVMRAEGCSFSEAVRIVAGVGRESDSRSESRFRATVGGGSPLSARSARLTSPQSSREALLAALDATERRNAAIRAANDADAEFATACESRGHEPLLLEESK
jgi:hypothetical protein